MNTSQTFDLSAAAILTTGNPEIDTLLRNLKLANQIVRNNPSISPKLTENEETPQPGSTLTAQAGPTSPQIPVNAVVRCCNALDDARQDARSRGCAQFEINNKGDRAYIDAIPRLHNPENISDFIACVAYAMLIGIIHPADGTKILYAAQIATQAAQASQNNKNIADRNKSTDKIPK